MYHSTKHPAKFMARLDISIGLLPHDWLFLSRKESTLSIGCTGYKKHPSAFASNEEDPWYADSGANNHVTAALDNLTLQEPFKGDEEVVVSNGTSLAISNIASSVLYNSKSPFQQPFKLTHILYYLTIAANLLSIHKFFVYNKCWFILIDSNFCVKENLTRQTLLQRSSRDGLYPIQLSKSNNKVKKFVAFLGVSASSKTWHRRLGHPSPPILNKIKHLAKLPKTGSSSLESLYEPSQLVKSKCLPFSTSNYVTMEPLEIVHSDLWVPLFPILMDVAIMLFLLIITQGLLGFILYTINHKPFHVLLSLRV